MSCRWFLGVVPLLLLPACASSGPEPMAQPARYLVAPAPVYPEASRRAQEAGTVTLRVQVKADETLGFIDVKSSSGFARLDAAAIQAVKKASFAAAKSTSGKRIDSVLVVPISFKRD
jgi:periplasmic protein TonB